MCFLAGNQSHFSDTSVCVYLYKKGAYIHEMCVCTCSVTQSCLTLWDPSDCSPAGSSVLGVLWARILEWLARPSSGGSSPPRIKLESCASPASARSFFPTGPPTFPQPPVKLQVSSFLWVGPWAIHCRKWPQKARALGRPAVTAPCLAPEVIPASRGPSKALATFAD